MVWYDMVAYLSWPLVPLMPMFVKDSAPTTAAW